MVVLDLNADNVEVASTGAVYLAPLGSVLPTSSDEALDAAFLSLGYLSEDGITEAPGIDTETIKAWQNGDTVRTLQTGHSLAYEFTMIETNEVTLAAYYGAVEANGDVLITGASLPIQAMVVDVIDQGQIRRRVFERAQITERGEVSLTNSDATGYPVTVTTYPGADGVAKGKILAPKPLPVNGGEG